MLLSVSLLFVSAWLSAQTEAPAGGRQGAVNALVCDAQGRLLSAGSDGVLEIWDVENKVVLERFQISPYAINDMVLRPDTTQISVIESDGQGRYRVSAWNYAKRPPDTDPVPEGSWFITKERLFSLEFTEPVVYINYSAAGSFLIITRGGKDPLLFVDAETGKSFDVPPLNTLAFPDGEMKVAATGRSEKIMITYHSGGVISYWDLKTGEEIRHFIVSSNLRSPILFGSNRFFAGFDSGVLLVLDAVSGRLITYERVSQGKAFPGLLVPIDTSSGDQGELLCISYEARQVYLFNLTNTGKLEEKNRWSLPPELRQVMSAAITGDTTTLGTANGSLWSKDQAGTISLMQARSRRGVREAAASAGSLGLLCDGYFGLIPADYELLKDEAIISLEALDYTGIAASPDDGNFLLWQERNAQLFPVIRGRTDRVLNQLSPRYLLRDADIFGGKALFLDAVGKLTVLSTDTGEILFSFVSVDILDALFLDEDNILIGQNDFSGHSAVFLRVNISTGETVPITVPLSIAGIRVYRSSSEITPVFSSVSAYGVVLDRRMGKTSTVIMGLNLMNPSFSIPIDEREGEHTDFGLTECGGILCSTLNREAVALYGTNRFLERSPGLLRRLVDGGSYLIALDTEGNVGWYDPESGELLALLSLYEDAWVLMLRDGSTYGGNCVKGY
jgi:WD40 repeat protein